MSPDWLLGQVADQQKQRTQVFQAEEAGRYINLDRAMLKELELSGFRSGKCFLLLTVSVKHGTGSYLLKHSAKEKRQRAKPMQFPLAERPMVFEEAKHEEPGDVDMMPEQRQTILDPEFRSKLADQPQAQL